MLRENIAKMFNRKGQVRNPDRIPIIMSSIRKGWYQQSNMVMPGIRDNLRIGYLTEDTSTYRRLSGRKLTVPLWVPEAQGINQSKNIITEMESEVTSVHLPIRNYLREDGYRDIDLTVSALEMSWMACWTWRFGELLDKLGDTIFQEPEKMLRSSEIAWHSFISDEIMLQ